MTTRQHRKQMKEFLAGKTLDELLTAHDTAESNPTTTDAYTARLIADTAHNRAVDHARAMDSHQACDALAELLNARLQHGAHALPSWRIRVETLTRTLSDRHPTGKQAMADWSNGSHPDQDTPMGALIEAVRASITDQPLT